LTNNGENKVNQHETINYIELPATDIVVAKQFFSQVFGWAFSDFGDDYAAFSNAGIAGGFYRSELKATTAAGSVLVVFYSADLEATRAKIEAHGGTVVRPVFTFPGGRRFHFSDPNGNEYAVWSE
jgi:predicted enzyme related to lactoylglutathione lyase